MMPHVRGASLSNYAEVAQQLGLDPSAMLRRFDIDRRALVDADLRIPTGSVAELLEASAAASGCATFGLQMAESRGLADLGALSLLITHQATMRDALMTLIQYRRLLNESLVVQVEEHEDLVLVRQDLVLGGNMPARQAYELAIGVMYRLFRSVLGPRWRPLSVNFSHGAPPDTSVHLRVFGPIVEFGSDFDGLTCNRRDLDAANPSADPGLAQFAEKYVRTLPYAEGGSLSNDVQKAIYVLLPVGQASISRVAASVGLTPRTLQRRLAAEATEFSLLLNDIRRDLTVRYVANQRLPLSRVADLVGYASQSAFSRWFAEEFAVSPRSWRRQNGVP